MPHITSGISGFSGSNSGLDLKALVKKLVDVERKPIDAARLKQVGLTAKLSSFSGLRVSLSSLKAALLPLSTLSITETKSASTSDSSVVTARADSSAAPGIASINQVVQLARAHKLGSGSFDAPSAKVGSGRLEIKMGKEVVSVINDSQHQSLTDIRDKINAADAGVTASVLKVDEEDYRLVIQGNKTGTKNLLSIDVLDDDGGHGDETGLSQLRHQPGDPFAGTPEAGLTTIQEAQDAIVIVDNISFIRPTNIVDDLIPGVTLTLQKETEEKANITVNVSSRFDSAGMKGQIESFVTAYNNLIRALNTAQLFDAKTGEKGPLLGDATARTITGKFHALVQGRVPGLKGAFTGISQIGIVSEKDGTLKIDPAKLDAALLSDPVAVGRLFSGDNSTDTSVPGMADLTLKYVSNLQSVTTGDITFKEKGLKGSIATIDAEITKLTKQVESFEVKTRERFAKLEGVLQRLEGIGSGLSGQLTQINGLLGSLRNGGNIRKRTS